MGVGAWQWVPLWPKIQIFVPENVQNLSPLDQDKKPFLSWFNNDFITGPYVGVKYLGKQ